MNIRISDLPFEGLKISDTIPTEGLNARLQEGQQLSDIEFTSPPLVEITCFRRTEGAEIKGIVTTKYRQSCGRCADKVERDLKVDANYILKPKPDSMPGQEGDYTDDIGVIYYEGDHLDLESVIQESLIISISIYWSAQVNEDGKCSICGVKCEAVKESTSGKPSFGDLLKKAGVN